MLAVWRWPMPDPYDVVAVYDLTLPIAELGLTVDHSICVLPYAGVVNTMRRFDTPAALAAFIEHRAGLLWRCGVSDAEVQRLVRASLAEAYALPRVSGRRRGVKAYGP